MTTTKPHRLSVTDYANAMKVTPQSVRWQCKNNKLPPGTTAEKVGSTWIITTSESL